jgi:hypothetical protein
MGKNTGPQSGLPMDTAHPKTALIAAHPAPVQPGPELCILHSSRCAGVLESIVQ